MKHATHKKPRVNIPGVDKDFPAKEIASFVDQHGHVWCEVDRLKEFVEEYGDVSAELIAHVDEAKWADVFGALLDAVAEMTRDAYK